MSKYQHTSMYCYPGTDVLINLFDVQDEEKLKELEKVYTLFRLSELQLQKPADPVDAKAFLAIHRYLLQDVYPFAGELRQEMISKGSSSFAHPKHIETHLMKIFEELKAENYLKDLPRNGLVSQLAYFLSELNALHPFREGNGRSIREFARQLLLNAGYRLDWEKVLEPAEIINAFVDSFNKDNNRLERLLDEIITR
ncbi:Fic family protein [Microbacterium sp. APC 3898]|uniref:protein adenylyltransferase n=2 Tax=Planococcus TaxID=1372 RepID=A0ABT7ZKA7_9BACL|nr:MULTISPECIES: Fic family protein [Terrabacteria group]MBD8014714.1 Fic family protein [Planococcus wigleyi]MDN3427585.1 Fic family protein [Planococcus sp. APC 4016]MDN3499136.1 Fic family protein [Microbacterium sp. APC 3898]